MRTALKYLTLLLLAAVLTLFLILPVYVVIGQGMRWELMKEIFTNFLYLEGLWNSLLIALATTAMVFGIALPLALLFDRYDFPLKKLANLMIMVPMILPPFVGALGFQQLLGHYGVVNTVLGYFNAGPYDFLGGRGCFWSICLIEALHLYPILYLNLVTALGNIDPAMQEAARNLGISPFRRFCRITLPLLHPGILAGGSIVLIWSFTELGTPLMFGFNRTTAVQIFYGLTEIESNPIPYALVALMLFFAALMYLLARLALRSAGAAVTKGAAGTAAVQLKSWRRPLPTLLFAAVTLTAALPHIALILTAFSRNWYRAVWPSGFTLMNFENALSHEIVVPSILNSLQYSLLAMAAALAVGFTTAVAVCRWKLKFAWLFDLMAMLPLAVPGIVIAFGYLGMPRYGFVAASPVLRAIFDASGNPLLILGAAYAIRRLPYVVRAVTAGLEQTPVDLENASRNLGGGAWMTLRRITLPLITANLAVGGLFAFSFSMLEVSDSLILAQRTEYYPITKAIYELSQILGSGPYVACAFGVWTMLFLAATLAAAGAILGRKIGAVFRF